MTLSEALKTGKLLARKEWMPIPYGVVKETDQGRMMFYYDKTIPVADSVGGSPGTVAHFTVLTLADILADDWQIKPEPREYWLGVVKFQTHLHERKILQAFDKKPTDKQFDAEGNPFIHVKELLEE